MSEQNANAVGCLGRMLTFLGLVWIGLIVLGGIGILSRLGVREPFIAGLVGTSIIPGLLFLASGRVLRRRAATMAEPEGQTSSTPVPDQELSRSKGKGVRSIRLEPTARPAPKQSTPPMPIPTPTREPTPPRPAQQRPRPVDPIAKARRDVAKGLEEAVAGLEESTESSQQLGSIGGKRPRPKTSQELVDEARRRWGVDKPR
ncbi:MAG TPA: hypothetical protein VMS99_05745 [Acidimicrobiia bacterium]|nr:hypothetical protein [Acidimicrobiia bacterium]